MNLNKLIDEKLKYDDSENAEVYALSFELVDGFRNYNRVTNCGVAYTDIGDDVCELIEEQFINLMKQATFNYRYADDIHYIMPIRDDDEYEAVEEFLSNYRKNEEEAPRE